METDDERRQRLGLTEIRPGVWAKVQPSPDDEGFDPRPGPVTNPYAAAGTGIPIPENFDGELWELVEQAQESERRRERGEDPNLVDAGIQNSWGKGPSPGYIERHRAIARYNAMGLTNNEICKKLNYSPTAVSLVLKTPWAQAEVAKYRTQFFDADIERSMKAMGSDAVKLIHKTILNDEEKPELRSTNARWAIEKLTGKAGQQINFESNTLNSFIDLLRHSQETGTPIEPITLDITPTAPDTPELPAGPDFDAWLDHNLK